MYFDDLKLHDSTNNKTIGSNKNGNIITRALSAKEIYADIPGYDEYVSRLETESKINQTIQSERPSVKVINAKKNQNLASTAASFRVTHPKREEYGIEGEYFKNPSVFDPRNGYTKPDNSFIRKDPRHIGSQRLEAARAKIKERQILKEDALKAQNSVFGSAEFDEAGNITSEISSRTKIAKEASERGKTILANGYASPGTGFAESYMGGLETPSFASKFDLGGTSGTKRILDYDLSLTTQKPGDFANSFELEAKDLTTPKIESNRKPFGTLADGTSVELSESAARKITPKKKPLLNSNEKMSSLGKLGKMALGGAVLGGVLMTMMSNGGHQTNEQLYGQQPVNR